MSYDRLCPAVLSNFEDRPIELFKGVLENPMAEAVYTNGSRQSVANNILTVRRAPSVRLRYNAYVIGNGISFYDDERESLGEPVSFLEFDGPYGEPYEDNTFYCSRAEVA